MTQLLNPNLHVIFIHVPIGVLIIGTLIELFAFLWRRSTFRVAGRWMILIGALATIPAATSGIFAARQAMGPENDGPWHELKQVAPLNEHQWHHLRDHVIFNGIAAAVLALLVIVWLGGSDRIRQRGHYAFLAVLVIAVALMTAGAWHGGEMVYAHATGTKIVTTGLPPVEDETSEVHESEGEHDAAKGRAVFRVLKSVGTQVARADDLLDIHALSAGWTIVFAVVALGLSIRNLSLAPRHDPATEDLANNDDIIDALAGRSAENRALMDPEDAVTRTEVFQRAPAARFWLIAALLAVFTVLGGWMIAGPSSWEDVQYIFETHLRARAHIIAALSIVSLTLVLALVARFAPHNRVLVGCFAFLLATALIVQLWLGILMVFDTVEGPINRPNAPTTQTVT